MAASKRGDLHRHHRGQNGGRSEKDKNVDDVDEDEDVKSHITFKKSATVVQSEKLQPASVAYSLNPSAAAATSTLAAPPSSDTAASAGVPMSPAGTEYSGGMDVEDDDDDGVEILDFVPGKKNADYTEWKPAPSAAAAAASSASDAGSAAAASVAIKKEKIDEEFELHIVKDTIEVTMAESRAKVKSENGIDAGANAEERPSTDREATPSIDGV